MASSFLSVYTFDFYPSGPYDESLDNFRLLTPGVLFSLFIITLQRWNWTLGKLILFFGVLLIVYCAALVAGASSWGVGVPFAGGIGALLIWKLFYRRVELIEAMGIKYLLAGFISGLVGLVLYYLLHDVWTDGVGFGFILITWQLTFGLLWIRQVARDSMNERECISTGS